MVRSWNVDICLVPALRTCTEHLKNQYNCDWEYKKLTEFNFEDGCNELEIELMRNALGNAARIECSSNMKIRREDVDFHHYYGDDELLEDLKQRMDQKLYPPRCKARVVTNKDFFAKSRSINFQLLCNAKCTYRGKITIPSYKNDLFGEDSSDADSTPPQKRKRFTASAREYESDDSIEHLENEDELVPGKLQLRNLIIQTKKAKHKWFELGVALKIPIDILEKLDIKYDDSPIKALIRVYRYWLADKNGLQPIWHKLITALHDINEYSIAAHVANNVMQETDQPHLDVLHGKPNERMKKLVMEHFQPELLDITTLLPLLNKCHLLTQSDNYTLLNGLIPPIERAIALVYKILPSKGPNAYILFSKCLQEEKEHAGHQELAKKFKPMVMETTL